MGTAVGGCVLVGAEMDEVVGDDIGVSAMIGVVGGSNVSSDALVDSFVVIGVGASG